MLMLTEWSILVGIWLSGLTGKEFCLRRKHDSVAIEIDSSGETRSELLT